MNTGKLWAICASAGVGNRLSELELLLPTAEKEEEEDNACGV
jgi:hypothetical protein